MELKPQHIIFFCRISITQTARLLRMNLTIRSSRPEVFLGKEVLKICSKFTGGHPCQSVILIKFQSNFIKNALRHTCSHVHLLHIFRTLFPKNIYGGMVLNDIKSSFFYLIFVLFYHDKFGDKKNCSTIKSTIKS